MAAPKPEAPPPVITVQVDEHWLHEWINFGYAEITAYLERYAAFDDYCQKRGTA